MKKLFYIFSLLMALLCAAPASATWTISSGYPATKTTCTSGSNTCTITVTSTTAGSATIVGVIGANTTANPISSIGAGFCSGSWTFGPGIGTSATGNNALGWCTNTAASQTSLVVNMTSNQTSTWILVVFNATATGAIAIDSGATANGTRNPTSCSSCAGVALNLSSNNKLIVGVASVSGTGTGCTGTGWTCTVLSGDLYGRAPNIATSGSLVSPTTWTQSATGSMTESLVALQETSGAVSPSPVNKNRKYEKLDETAIAKHYSLELP